MEEHGKNTECNFTRGTTATADPATFFDGSEMMMSGRNSCAFAPAPTIPEMQINNNVGEGKDDEHDKKEGDGKEEE